MYKDLICICVEKILLFLIIMYRFQEIYGQQTTNAEIYKTLLAPLVSRFVEGFNVCLFVIGETNSGRSFSLVGDGAKPGLLQIAMEDVFNHIAPSQF